MIDTLGSKESRWRRAITRSFDKNPNLAFSLLFAEKAPKTKAFKKKRESFIEQNNCFKSF